MIARESGGNAMKKIYLLLCIFSLAMAPAFAAGVEPLINVTAEAEVRIKPDRAALTFGLYEKTDNLRQGAQKLNTLSRQVTDYLRNRGIEDRFIQTDSLHIQPIYMYQTITLANGQKNIFNKKSKKILDIISKMVVKKYLDEENDTEFNEKFEKLKNIKQERLQLFDNKKEFITQITQEKRSYTKEIERIDKLLNNNELLKKEYYSRNEKLPNKEKIFSVSYLVGILDKERAELIEKIEECNKLILPKEFVEQKSKLEEEVNFLKDILETNKESVIIQLATEFLQQAKKLIFIIRYIPINDSLYVKDIEALETEFEEIIKLIIKKAQELKIWDVFSEDKELTYKILKEVFETKMIGLQNLNIQCVYENKVLTVEYYDDTIIESSVKIDVDNVKIKKKIKLFI